MLFNSYVFLLLFLPVTIAGFYGTGITLGKRAAMIWLVVASWFFYGYWAPGYLVLFLLSIGINYAAGLILSRPDFAGRKVFFGVAVTANLALIGYYKYAVFFVETVTGLSGVRIELPAIVLPIGISFYTFQQIAYLVDVHRSPTQVQTSFWAYNFFIAFFPQLIAGPIVHHYELLPQLRSDIVRWRVRRFAPGVLLFLVGLCKKGVFADRVAPLANSLFDSVAAGQVATCGDAWLGVGAYALQLYFDFSGYSDMACGLALMFNLRLPINFFSPYKANSLVEFWRRWHITLSRFLRDYLYIPMGGSHGGGVRRSAILLVTMLLGGLWHGAGWTFVFWGGLHGAGLAVNHAWRAWCQRSGRDGLPTTLAWPLTLFTVVVAWIFFRADSFGSAGSVIQSMAGLHGGVATELLFPKSSQLVLFAVLWLIVLIGPNSQTLLRSYRPFVGDRLEVNARTWRLPTGLIERPWGAFMLGCLLLVVLANMAQVSEFIYFQF